MVQVYDDILIRQYAEEVMSKLVQLRHISRAQACSFPNYFPDVARPSFAADTQLVRISPPSYSGPSRTQSLCESRWMTDTQDEPQCWTIPGVVLGT
jgi:hypothetical protein